MRREIVIVLVAGGVVALSPAVSTAQTLPPPGPVVGAQGNLAEAEVSDDIVVTAQRRAERARDVPLSVTALSGDALVRGGIDNATQLGQVTPGLNFQANGSTIQPAIRGVTSTGSNPGDAANVAIYVDGIYQPVQFSNFLDLVDIKQVEVLKGPQGTLFGRNATGGAISVTTLSPSFDSTGRVAIGYGRFDEVTGRAFVTGGLSSTIAASLALDYLHDDGYRRDLVTGAKLARTENFTGRGKLLFKSGTGLQVTVAADYTDSKNNTTFAGQPLNGNTAAAGVPGVVLATRPNTAALSFVPRLDIKGGGASVRIVANLAFADLTSLTAYRRYTSFQSPDSDVTNAAVSRSELDYRTRTLSQEFNLASSGTGSLRWIAGLFLFDDRQQVALQSFTGAPDRLVLSYNSDPVNTQSVALFGELTYAATETLTLLGGLRYSIDRIDYVGNINGGAYVSPPAATFRSLTPRASIRYAFDTDVNAYFTYSQGFKAGVYNPSSPSAITLPVRPERIDSYELGIKGRAGPVVSYSAAVYHYDYRDLQFQAFGATSLVTVLQNAANAKIDGAEVNAALSPGGGFTFSTGLSYVDGRYVDFLGAQAFTPRATGGNVSSAIDASGNRLIRTPKWSGNVSAGYDAEIGRYRLGLTGNIFWSGAVFYDVSNRTRQVPYEVVNLSATLTLPGDRMDIRLYGNNVTNRTYIASLLVSGLGDNVNYARPASYGARLTYRF